MRILSILICLVCLSSLNAQINQGAILLGGSVSFNGDNYTSELNSSTTTFEIENRQDYFRASPQVGYFINESVMIGLGVNYSFRSSEQDYSNSSTGSDSSIRESHVVSVSPFLTKYFSLVESLYFTTRFSIDVGIGTEKVTNNNESESDIFEIGASIGPGLTYFLSDRWAATGRIGSFYYNRTETNLTSSNDSSEERKNVNSSYGFSASLNTFSIGVQYFLRNDSNE